MRRESSRGWPLVVGAVCLVAAAVVAFVVVRVTDSPETSSLASPSSESSPPDPSSLRYPEPLPDGAVAFVNDLSLPAPVVSEPAGVPGPEPQAGTRQARFVLMDGAEVLATGFIGELPLPWDPSEYTGEPVDIGVDGAVFTDDEEDSIAYPVDGGVRIVASQAAVMFGSADPAVTPEELAAVAGGVNVSEDWFAADLAHQGIHVFDELVSSRPGPGAARSVVVEHGMTRSAVLHRFDQPLSEQRFVAFAAHATVVAGRELPSDVELGDTAIDLEIGYVELLSPVDVAVVAFPHESIETLLDVAAADELDAAFDGSVDAPLRPGP